MSDQKPVAATNGSQYVPMTREPARSLWYFSPEIFLGKV